ncbi:MAG: hypothetical protein P8163_19790, partial [Candidatus Thiodiazotropha sp.]
PDNMCIAGLAIDKYTTPYQYERKQEFYFFNTVSRDRSGLLNRENGELLAEASIYRFYPGWLYEKLAALKLVKRRHFKCSGSDKPKGRDFFSGIIDESFVVNMKHG